MEFMDFNSKSCEVIQMMCKSEISWKRFISTWAAIRWDLFRLSLSPTSRVVEVQSKIMELVLLVWKIYILKLLEGRAVRASKMKHYNYFLQKQWRMLYKNQNNSSIHSEKIKNVIVSESGPWFHSSNAAYRTTVYLGNYNYLQNRN